MNAPKNTGFTLIEIMIVVGIIGILAAIAIPSYQHAIAEARKKACAMNRKNIDGAKLRWSLEQKKSPDDTPTDAEVFGEKAYIEHKPDCPAGGAYSLNAAAEKCTCSYPVHAN